MLVYFIPLLTQFSNIYFQLSCSIDNCDTCTCIYIPFLGQIYFITGVGFQISISNCRAAVTKVLSTCPGLTLVHNCNIEIAHFGVTVF